jgi:hypothetical protein
MTSISKTHQPCRKVPLNSSKRFQPQYTQDNISVFGVDFESVASLWLCAKKYKTLNICTTAVMWSLWKLRNDMCFQVNQWLGIQGTFFRCAKLLRRWCLIQSEEVANQLGILVTEWEKRGTRPPELTWGQLIVPPSESSCSGSQDAASRELGLADFSVIDFSLHDVDTEPGCDVLPVLQSTLDPGG